MRKCKVLIPLDDSEFSQKIIPYVRNLLNPAKHELILFHVAPAPQGILGAPAVPAADSWPWPMYPTYRDAKRASHPIYADQVWGGTLAAIEGRFRPHVRKLEAAGFAVATVVRHGDAVELILETVKERKVDLVAMTTHGRTGLSRLIHGSVAGEVLRRALVPVLLLRPFAPATKALAQDETSSEVSG
jgi:nucleotide-binding universal stress UspA family protein